MPVALLIIRMCILIEPPLEKTEEEEKQESFQGIDAVTLVMFLKKVPGKVNSTNVGKKP